jgi:beta-lactamase regulating signal transducer with metallopeptidase domain
VTSEVGRRDSEAAAAPAVSGRVGAAPEYEPARPATKAPAVANPGTPADMRAATGAAGPSALRASLPRPALSLSAVLMLGWASVLVVLLARFGWVQWRMWRRLREAQPLDPARLPIDFSALRRRAGVRRAVRLLVNRAVSSPAVWGLRRPCIVVPPGLLDRLKSNQLSWLILHELAHIRRGDLWVAALQRLVQIVYFFNPAVWLANWIIDRQREYACDDAALAACQCPRRDCGEALLSLVERASPSPACGAPALGLFHHAVFTRRRLMRILDHRRRIGPRRLSFGASILLVCVATVALPRLQAQDAEPAVRPAASADDEKDGAPRLPDTRATGERAAAPAAGVEKGFIPPPLEKPLDQMLREIEARIAELRQAGSLAEADRLAEQLASAKAPLSPSFQPPRSDELELHVVGLYEGKAYSLARGKADVKVTHTSAPIILCLTSYEAVAWHLRLESGVQLRQVILGGYEPQQVIGLPEDVPVADYSRRTAERSLGYTYAKQHEDYGDSPYRQLAERLRELTDLEISTFQGAYRAGDEPIVVGPASKAWREERALEAVRQVYYAATRPQRQKRWAEIRRLTFSAAYRERVGRYPHDVTTYYGEHTVAGPIEGKLLEVKGSVSRLAVDPRGPTYYTDRIDTIDPKTGKRTKLNLESSLGLPRFSHVCGLAFDSGRHRLMVATLGGTGYLYSYSPDEDQWSLVRDMSNVDLAALCYSANDDLLYGLAFPYREGPTLYQFHHQGAILQQRKVPAMGLFGYHPFDNVRMAAAGKYLVVISPPAGHDDEGRPGPAAVYVVDPQSGEVVFTCRQLPPQSLEAQQRALAESIARASQPKEGHLAPMPKLRDDSARGQLELELAEPIAPIYNPQNGHYYERVKGKHVTWEQAKTIAESRTYQDMQGYLATVTSKEENDFLFLQWGQAGSAWMGASDAEQEGNWKWVTGPEAGTVFWIGDADGKAVGYHNWGRGGQGMDEPNNTRGSEHYAAWNWGLHPSEQNPGVWNDFDATRTQNAILVEYSPKE